jgi:serine/threonine-protein kinase
MAVQVGQTLDKYELLERVGQGGMAVVYRASDRSLRREVAIKVLHHHLAEHQEARERFEREAHAVAKLRHENILEIYDFSGIESEESYIVTEFIDGESLKEFITGHAIKHPEIGAMVTVQVCKALQHAHAAGVLHRDVKPENIMIRSDGVVKLTDFGIAQMIDLQRLTVTGQLLGSPAYMSPEHVNGGQLDFRTDVFAVGIVLYQLVTNELPFKGKNPHEILKRIAECDYLDPQVVNPLVGKRLARIITKSLAREKDDRYADVSQQLAALEKFLAESGLSSYRDELARYFAAPDSYEMALKERLVEHLTKRGKALVQTDQLAALEMFNRVLTMEPDHREVLVEIDRMGQRKRSLRLVAMACGVLLAAGFVLGAKTMIARGQGPVAERGGVPDFDTALAQVPAPIADAAPAVIFEDAGVEAADAAPLEIEDAAVEVAARADARIRVERKRDAAAEVVAVDAAPEAKSRTISLTVSPPVDSTYRVNGGPWQPVTGPSMRIEVPAGAVSIEANNECCRASRISVQSDAASARVDLTYPPALITPVCSRPGVRAKVDGNSTDLGSQATIFIERVTGDARVSVSFFAEGYLDEQTVSVNHGQKKEVRCR